MAAQSGRILHLQPFIGCPLKQRIGAGNFSVPISLLCNQQQNSRLQTTENFLPHSRILCRHPIPVPAFDKYRFLFRRGRFFDELCLYRCIFSQIPHCIFRMVGIVSLVLCPVKANPVSYKTVFTPSSIRKALSPGCARTSVIFIFINDLLQYCFPVLYHAPGFL